MAFCNSCGAALTPGIRFCSKCGAAVLASAPITPSARPAVSPTPGAVPAAQAPRQGGSALKIILIILAVIVVMGILAMGTLGFIGWRVARKVHLRQQGGNVNVETPFGNVKSSQDPNEVIRDLTVEIYPGAQVQKEGSTSTTIMGIHTTTAHFESSDSLDKVSTFYKSKFPNAMVSTCDQDHCTIVSNDQKNSITINMDAEGSGTKIQITQISR
jgi:hypothetical protein